jgi:hypothetical protein
MMATSGTEDTQYKNYPYYLLELPEPTNITPQKSPKHKDRHTISLKHSLFETPSAASPSSLRQGVQFTEWNDTRNDASTAVTPEDGKAEQCYCVCRTALSTLKHTF